MTDYYRNKVHHNEIIATFDDVLIIPGYTYFNPSEIEIKSKLGKYEFYLPILSAAMDTVTEVEMAIKMALFGGLGVIHRNCSYEKQLEMVRIVKRARSFVIEDVATISPSESIVKAKYMMENYNISGLVVTNEKKKVCGILTKRDIPFSEQQLKDGVVKDFMTKEVISINPGASRNDALNKLFESRKEKLPIIDEKGFLKGLITKKDLAP
ncbi:MAG: IMP dehydrogenase, partial [Candidatus Thorarchaeota archaeon]